MEVIRKNIQVDASRRVTLELPESVGPGEHEVLVVVSKNKRSSKEVADLETAEAKKKRRVAARSGPLGKPADPARIPRGAGQSGGRDPAGIT